MDDDELRYPPSEEQLRNLDFSEFHPLDHWPGSARCHEFFGGWRHHLRITWAFRRKPQLLAATRCRLGWHRPTTAFRPSARVMWRSCHDCGRRLGPNQPMDQLK